MRFTEIYKDLPRQLVQPRRPSFHNIHSGRGNHDSQRNPDDDHTHNNPGDDHNIRIHKDEQHILKKEG